MFYYLIAIFSVTKFKKERENGEVSEVQPL